MLCTLAHLQPELHGAARKACPYGQSLGVRQVFEWKLGRCAFPPLHDLSLSN
jgi:hypothetical protein